MIEDRPTAEVVGEVDALTRLPLIAAGGVDGAHFWAGTGYRSATDGPAAKTIRQLASAVQ